MKKLIIAVCLFASTAQAQTRDTTTIQDMQYNLYRSHHQYRTGTVMTLIGLIAVGASLAAKDADLPSKEMAIIGGGFIAIGGIIHLDSHKWIGRAGRKIVNKNHPK